MSENDGRESETRALERRKNQDNEETPRKDIAQKNSPDSSKPDQAQPKKDAWYRRPVLVTILIVILIGAAVGGTLWWRHSRDYQKTDDAFIDVVSEHVSPQVAGRVLRVLVND